MSKLNVKQVAAFAGPCRLSDGNNLYLTAKSAEQKSWLFIFKSPVTGKQREMGLGPAGKDGVPLAEAREKADTARKLIRDGKDPLEERLAELKQLEAEAKVTPTFGDFADDYVRDRWNTWRNEKHAEQWKVSVGKHALALRPMPLNTITTEHVLEALKPMWRVTPETASRFRGRLYAILSAAKVAGHRTGENPAMWKDHLEHILPGKTEAARGAKFTRGPQRALHRDRVPEFMAKLRQREELGARPLEFAILCVNRSNEARGALWPEFNLSERMWTIPGERMKEGKEHRIPLTKRALEILELMKPLKIEGCDLVFPSRDGTVLSDPIMTKTIEAMGYKAETSQHGFRSTFSDWRAEATHFPYELAEMALAHAVGNKVERAYRRGDMFEKRREIMRAWEAHCSGAWMASDAIAKLAAAIGDATSNVVPLRATA